MVDIYFKATMNPGLAKTFADDFSKLVRNHDKYASITASFQNSRKIIRMSANSDLTETDLQASLEYAFGRWRGNHARNSTQQERCKFSICDKQGNQIKAKKETQSQDPDDSKYGQLSAQHEELKVQYAELQGTHAELVKVHGELEELAEASEREVVELRAENTKLESLAGSASSAPFFHYLPANLMTEQYIEAYAQLKQAHEELHQDLGDGTTLEDYTEESEYTSTDKKEYEEAKRALSKAKGNKMLEKLIPQIQEKIRTLEQKKESSPRHKQYLEVKQKLEEAKVQFSDYTLQLSYVEGEDRSVLFFPFNTRNFALEQDILELADEKFGASQELQDFTMYPIPNPDDYMIDLAVVEFQVQYKERFGVELSVLARHVTEKTL